MDNLLIVSLKLQLPTVVSLKLQLPTVVSSNFNVNVGKSAISGHSMGGHGALIAALRNPGKYKVAHIFIKLYQFIQMAKVVPSFS